MEITSDFRRAKLVFCYVSFLGFRLGLVEESCFLGCNAVFVGWGGERDVGVCSYWAL